MGRHILVVEDEPAFAEVLCELLREEGYGVVVARDGITALNMLSASAPRPDMVICDVMLPGLRGDRLVAEIRRRYPQRRVPILLMSASSDPRVRLPHVDFMAKPFETDELLSRIAAMLGSAVPSS